jgi:type I restriction enzyme S subunit
MNGKQLKNSILQWAIQGKLVPQDPNDEPASVLLERIRAEKAKLVKEKKIKKDKNESIIYRGDDNSYYEKFIATGEVKCIDEEIPFEIPKGWSVCRLNDLAVYRKGPFGSSLTKSMFVPKSDTSIKVYEQKNAIQKNYELGEYYISKAKYEMMQSFIVEPSDIIVSCAGTIGETYQLPSTAPIGIINQALMRVKLYNLEIAKYWEMYFRYILLNEAEMKGAGSAIKNIPPFEYLKAIIVTIPPMAEQKRIIDRYLQLSALSDNFDVLQKELNNLNSEIFPFIKKSILQEAIQGKLVPQITEEGTAKELLEQIRKEKQKLVTDGKLKKSALSDSIICKGDDNKYFEKVGKTEQDITDEIPFEIPDDWKWCRIGSILNIWSARRVHERDWRSSGIPFYRAREIGKMADWGHVDNDLFIEQSLYDEFSKSGVPQIGDLMMTAVGTLGKTYVVETNNPFYYKDGSVLCIGNPFRLNPYYLKLFFESSAFANQYLSESDGTTVATLTMVRLNRYLIPVPPLKEQTRIVEKIKTVTSIMRG